MADITYPNDLTNGTTADADEVMANFAAVATQVNGGIAETNLADSAVTAVKLATDAVETAKIKDANVTLAKMAANSVDTSQLVNDSVSTAKIEAGAVDTTELAADAVDGTKLADDAVDSEHIAAGGVDTTALANEAVEETKISWLQANGARAVRVVGVGDSGMGTDGIGMLRCVTDVTAGTASQTVTFTGGEARDGGFTWANAADVHCVGLVYEPDAAGSGEVEIPDKMSVEAGSISTTSADIALWWDGSETQDGTLYSTWVGPTDV